LTELICDDAASAPEEELTQACRVATDSSSTQQLCRWSTLLLALLTAKRNQDLAVQNPGLYLGNPKKVC